MTAFVAAVIWTALHYHLAGVSLITKFNSEIARNLVLQTNVAQIEAYHERYVFRDLMFLLALVVMIGYASLAAAVSTCRACEIPFATAATFVILISLGRMFVLLLRAYFDYHRYRELCREIRYLKTWRDEQRFRDFVVPSVASRYNFSPYTVVEGMLVVASMCFLVLGTVWVETDACITTCSRSYHLCKYLTVTMYGVEGLYILSVLALYYLRRAYGVEQLEITIKWIDEDNIKREEARKEQIRNPRPKDEYIQ